MLVEDDRLRSRPMRGVLFRFQKLWQRKAQHSETADAKNISSRGQTGSTIGNRHQEVSHFGLGHIAGDSGTG